MGSYFSASGVTAKVADMLADAVGADIHEICSKVPYMEIDLSALLETEKEKEDKKC